MVENRRARQEWRKTIAGVPPRPVLSLALALGTAAAGAPVLPAQTRDWSPEDRAVIGDCSHILAVAASQDQVFVATASALLVWEPRSRSWRGPWQPRNAAALGEVIAALADPLDGSVWLVRRSGWLRFDPGIQLWEQGTVPGAVLDAALDERAPVSGLFLRTAGGWYTAQRGGIALPGAAPTRPVRGATTADAVRDNPAIQANSASLLSLTRLRNVRYTAAARAQGFTGRGWFLGTSGAGVLFFADGAAFPEPLLFGLPGDAVDAVFAGTGGVWAVTERTPIAEPGVSYVATNLGQFQWLMGSGSTGLPFARARRIVGRESDLWVATDGGVIRLTPRTEEVSRYDEGRGLPDPRVLDLAQRRGRIVAATVHGLADYTDSTGFQPLAPAFTGSVQAVAVGGDTVWVGTSQGLLASLPGEADLLEPDALRETPAMRGAVLDLVWRADTLVALLDDRLMWRDPRTGRFTLGPLLGSAPGRLHTVVNGRSGLYVAGDRGVGAAGLGSSLRRVFTTPGDLPGQVTDLAVDDDYLWVATLRGLVRFRLDLFGS